MEPIARAVAEHWGLTLAFAVALFWIAAATLDSILKHRSREMTRRELAAYVAEGSMTPEQADRILKGGRFARFGIHGPSDEKTQA